MGSSGIKLLLSVSGSAPSSEGERPRDAGDRVRVRPRSLTVLRSSR